MTNGSDPTSLALVLGGGGARAAYQVGFLRSLAKQMPEVKIPIITGVSAGAINCAHLANYQGSFPEAVETLAVLWDEINTSRVFRTDARSLGRLFVQWFLRLGSGGSRRTPSPRGLVDTTPLREFLTGALKTSDGTLDGIAANIASGRLEAAAVTTTDFGTGRTVTWVQGDHVEGWKRSTRLGRPATLTLDHVMASSAVPLFFPAVRIGDSWHGDGGIRQIAPLSPALKLGASRIIAISTRYARSIEEAECLNCEVYPPPAQVVGVMLNAAFLDLLDYDARTLRRISNLVEKLPEHERMGFRPSRVLLLRPSRDLGVMATEHEASLPRSVRWLSRGLGTKDTRSHDLTSMLMFEPDYLDALMDLGERDAEAQVDEIAAFITGT